MAKDATTPIEAYHATKLAAEKARAAVDELVTKLAAVVKELERDPVAMLAPRKTIRYPVEDGDKDRGFRIDEDDLLGNPLSLDEMPAADVLRGAIIKMRNANAEETKAFDALSEIEKGYVRPQTDQQRRRR